MLRTISGLSKHFFEIFPNFIWESSLNIYYLDKPGLLRNWNSLFNKSYYQLFKLIKIWRVWKSSDSQFHSKKITTLFSLIITGNFIKKAWIITKINFFNFNKSTELLFVQLRLFDDWKEEFRSWANKSRSLAIGCRICGNEQSCEKKKENSKNSKNWY